MGFLPDWLWLLFAGLYVFAMMAMSCVIWSRAGKSPYYALFWLVPYVQLLMFWMLAFQRWPAIDPPDSEA
ncbi:MAG: hypothetical protein OXT65_10575 [Alphaproteobacteria bacterium]|nr:hypothetical protein [Alphaproteobacteria bacterium]